MAEANQASLSLLGLALASTEYPVEARPRLFLDPPTSHLLLQVTVHAAPCCSCLRSCLLLWLLFPGGLSLPICTHFYVSPPVVASNTPRKDKKQVLVIGPLSKSSLTPTS